MTTNDPLRARGLTASYDGRQVFTGASLSLPFGLHALQGANGSGKSTLLRLLAGAQAPEAGEVWIGNESLHRQPRAARRRLAYAPDDCPIYPFMTGREFLRFVAKSKDVMPPTSSDQLVLELGLDPHLDTRFDAMSLGTQKKLLLRAAFIGSPLVMLMDEPSNGLDAAARAALFARLRAHAQQAVILCATHDAAMIEETGAAIITMPEILSVDQAAT